MNKIIFSILFGFTIFCCENKETSLNLPYGKYQADRNEFIILLDSNKYVQINIRQKFIDTSNYTIVFAPKDAKAFGLISFQDFLITPIFSGLYDANSFKRICWSRETISLNYALKGYYSGKPIIIVDMIDYHGYDHKGFITEEFVKKR